MNIAESIASVAADFGATGTPENIVDALDMLIDALAGEDVEAKKTIAEAMVELGNHIAKPASGSVEISKNGNTSVSGYATAVVNVPAIYVAYDANGGTGTVATVHIGKGSSVELSDGTGLTAPESKEFAGWATAAAATESDVTSPYTPSGSVTLYAVWADVL